MSKFSVYSIGRTKDVDIQLDDESVSRHHAELTLTAEGKFYLADCNSSGGTYLLKGGAWAVHQQAYVAKTDTVRLGQYQISVEKLALTIKEKAGKGSASQWHSKDDLPSGPVHRNTLTGEIIGQDDK